jgi:hypothetical protein
MSDQAITGLHIKTDERTFKTLGDEILRMIATNDQQALQRSALVNSARTFIEIQIVLEGYDPSISYRPMEYYMTEVELIQPFANLDIYRLKLWLQHNMNVFEKKDKGGILT